MASQKLPFTVLCMAIIFLNLPTAARSDPISGVLMSKVVDLVLDKADDDSGYRVTSSIEVLNRRQYRLTNAAVHSVAGQVSDPATSVSPGRKETMVAHKTGWSVFGTCGTVSWLIEGQNRRLVVMWDVPYFHWFGLLKSKLAVGFYKGTRDPGTDAWYHTMESGAMRDWSLSFRSAQVSKTSQSIIIRDDSLGLEAEAHMGSSLHTIVEVILKPLPSRGR